jgi:multidrug transporter EmrE-like cation transporter
MNAYLALGIAIVAEVVATSALKASDGFSRAVPALIVIVGYSVAFYSMSLALKTVPVGIAYAIWCGLGMALISVAAFVLYGQKINFPGWIGIALILCGVVVLNVFASPPAD